MKASNTQNRSLHPCTNIHQLKSAINGLTHMIPASLRRARNKRASAEMAKNATEQRDKSCSPDTMNGAIKNNRLVARVD